VIAVLFISNFSFCGEVEFVFRYPLRNSMLYGLFPCASVMPGDFELFIAVDNYELVVLPEVGIPASQDVGLQVIDLIP